ncbi:zinc finger and BTB domain-containing protein 34 [Notechis scutatus]|uniref:Zinc finger and BTB domain-containing protein 34 n=1 Tax=Notechis scutatus TaxID=8663 RepID=A0A6J1VF93_9SAUR|nr:zinc finger and BTB domain-containing protein 34 [Notechis scutatus]
MDSSSFIQFDVPEYSSSVLSQLNELRLQGKLCDIVVHIQGQPFRAHKAVLAASSPYFRDHSALNTMSGLSISVIKNPSVFEQLLSFCYTGRMSLQLKDVVSFLTAASFLQMQCVIDKCTQILESIHSKISVGEVDSVTIGAEDPLENHNGLKEGSYFANPVEISPPPYCAQGRPPASGNDLRMETTPVNAFRGRLQEEGHSDRGSSGSVSEYEIQVEGDHDQAELIIRESQAAEVKVKMEKSDRPSCSDSSSLGDDGYHTEMVDGEQVVAVNVGSYGSVLQNAFSYSQGASQSANASESFGSLRSSSSSRSMLGSYRGRGRQKRVSTSHLHSDVSSLVSAADGEPSAHQPGYESGSRERNSRGHWYAYSERLICIYCGKSFNQKGSLDRHMRLHMGITPFVCKYCGKKYTRKDQLEYHIRGHTDDKPFRCEVCGKCFPFQGTLNQHLRKNHPGVAEIRSRVESPERTEVYMEQRDDDTSVHETLDYTMDVHTPD